MRAGTGQQLLARIVFMIARFFPVLRLAVGVGAVVAVSGSTAPGARPRTQLYRLASAVDIDTIGGFATLRVYQGFVARKVVWYIVTESSDRSDAARRGVTWAPRLNALVGTPGVQRAHDTRGTLTFESGVDFTPERSVIGNPQTGFPPTTASPGSVADPFYSPFVLLDNGVVINAPIVADEYAALDRVERLDPVSGTVRLRLSRGYVDDKTVWYITTDASDPMVAAMEGATLAPALRAVPGQGATDAAGSARTGILAVINGETGRENPERQGLESALLDVRAPLNVLEHAPDASGKAPIYTPAWDLYLVRWTDDVVRQNQRHKIFSWTEASALVSAGVLVPEGPTAGGAPARALRPARVVINERTGTVIVGHQVRISSVAIAHGNLVIKPNVSVVPAIAQAERPPADKLGPPPREDADPIDDILKSLRPRPLPGIEPSDQPLTFHNVDQTFTVADLARILNALGVSPRDLIAIFQALKESGAMHADLVVI